MSPSEPEGLALDGPSLALGLSIRQLEPLRLPIAQGDAACPLPRCQFGKPDGRDAGDGITLLGADGKCRPLIGERIVEDAAAEHQQEPSEVVLALPLVRVLVVLGHLGVERHQRQAGDPRVELHDQVGGGVRRGLSQHGGDGTGAMDGWCVGHQRTVARESDSQSSRSQS